MRKKSKGLTVLDILQDISDELERREKLAKDIFRQKELSEWQKKNFTKGETGICDTCPFRMLAGMTEELGELAHAVLKYKQGIRGMTEEKMKKEAGDAFGDVNVYGCQLLTQLGLNAEEEVAKATDEVLKRDWKKDKTTGGTEACHKGGEHEWEEFSKGDFKYRKCAKCDIMDLRPACHKGGEHDWRKVSRADMSIWKECKKCGVAVNYDDEGKILFK